MFIECATKTPALLRINYTSTYTDTVYYKMKNKAKLKINFIPEQVYLINRGKHD